MALCMKETLSEVSDKARAFSKAKKYSLEEKAGQAEAKSTTMVTGKRTNRMAMEQAS